MNPGDRRQFYLRLDRRRWPSAGHRAGRAFDLGLGAGSISARHGVGRVFRPLVAWLP